MSHEHRLKHQMHYASLEEASKNFYEKQFTTVTTLHAKMFKIITMKNAHIM